MNLGFASLSKMEDTTYKELRQSRYAVNCRIEDLATFIILSYDVEREGPDTNGKIRGIGFPELVKE